MSSKRQDCASDIPTQSVKCASENRGIAINHDIKWKNIVSSRLLETFLTNITCHHLSQSMSVRELQFWPQFEMMVHICYSPLWWVGQILTSDCKILSLRYTSFWEKWSTSVLAGRVAMVILSFYLLVLVGIIKFYFIKITLHTYTRGHTLRILNGIWRVSRHVNAP